MLSPILDLLKQFNKINPSIRNIQPKSLPFLILVFVFLLNNIFFILPNKSDINNKNIKLYILFLFNNQQ